MVIVQIQGEKLSFNQKRIKLKVPASQLYSPDYDFSIMFDSAETRKTWHQLERKDTSGLILDLEK